MRKSSSFSLSFSVVKRKRTKTNEARSTCFTPKKAQKSKDTEMGEMGEAQIGLSNQASERDTVMAATKTGCLDVIKNSQRGHPGRPAK